MKARNLLFLWLFFICQPIFPVSASDGTYDDKIILVWKKIPVAAKYKILRIDHSPKKIYKGKEVALEPQILGIVTNTEFTDSQVSFGEYKYIIVALDHQDNEIHRMEDIGHRKVNDIEFFLEFQKGIDSSLPRIRTMKMLNFIGEKKSGWRGGHLIYKTTGIIKKPLRIMIKYEDFIDQSLKINGTYEVQIFKLLKQQGKLVGTLSVDGIYKGTITHDLIIDNGRAVGGTYKVQQSGKPMTILPWDITEHPLDDSQYEDVLKNTLKETNNE